LNNSKNFYERKKLRNKKWFLTRDRFLIMTRINKSKRSSQ
jgi:hypothetical protein